MEVPAHGLLELLRPLLTARADEDLQVQARILLRHGLVAAEAGELGANG